jgi:hypothetical protein
MNAGIIKIIAALPNRIPIENIKRIPNANKKAIIIIPNSSNGVLFFI